MCSPNPGLVSAIRLRTALAPFSTPPLGLASASKVEIALSRDPESAKTNRPVRNEDWSDGPAAVRMELALHAVKSGLSVPMASGEYNVPRTTLSDWVATGGKRAKPGHPPLLGHFSEGLLADWVKARADFGRGLTREAVKAKAVQIASKQGQKFGSTYCRCTRAHIAMQPCRAGPAIGGYDASLTAQTYASGEP